MKRLLGPLAFVLLLAGIMIGSACSNQGEGERCEEQNGNNDCNTDEGLICFKKSDLNSSASSDTCCPRDRTKATSPVCKIQSKFDEPGDGAVTPRPDATADADATDGLDASGDGSSDASEDANPVDASDQ